MKKITDSTTLGELEIFASQAGVTALRLETVGARRRRKVVIFNPEYGYHEHVADTVADALNGAFARLAAFQIKWGFQQP